MKQYSVHVVFTQPILGTMNSDPEIYTRYIGNKAPDAKSLAEEVAALGAEAVEDRGTTVFPKTRDGVPFLWDYQIKGFFKDASSYLAQVDGSRSSAIPFCHSKIDGMVFVGPRNVILNMPEASYEVVTDDPSARLAVTREKVDDSTLRVTVKADRPTKALLVADGWPTANEADLTEEGGLMHAWLVPRRLIRIKQRPLKAMTMQGPRVALAASEMLPAGTWCDFTVTMLADTWRHKSKRLTTKCEDALVEWLAYGRLRGMCQWRNAGWGAFRCRVMDQEGCVLFDNLGGEE